MENTAIAPFAPAGQITKPLLDPAEIVALPIDRFRDQLARLTAEDMRRLAGLSESFRSVVQKAARRAEELRPHLEQFESEVSRAIRRAQAQLGMSDGQFKETIQRIGNAQARAMLGPHYDR